MPFVPATPPPGMPAGTAIFARAQSVWLGQTLPDYIEFTTFIAQISPDPVRVAVRTSDGKAYVQTIPVHPNERPVAYPGVTLSGPDYSPLGICVSIGRCLGVLEANPFGNEPAADSGTGANGVPLRVIAKTRALANPYRVERVQYLDFDGLPVYDLTLAPLDDPDRFRLREVVIDATSYHVWKMIYYDPKFPNRLVSYGFGPVQDLWYLRQSCHAVPTKFSGLAVPACTPDVAMMWDYAFPKSIPDYYFDRTLYLRQSQSEPVKR